MSDVNMEAQFSNYTSFTAAFETIYSIPVDDNVTAESSHAVKSSGIFNFVIEKQSESFQKIDDEKAERIAADNTLRQAYYNDHERIVDLYLTKQNKLIDGENIKTVNGEAILGSGDISIPVPDVNKAYVDQQNNAQNIVIEKKQDNLVSGQNIKTINGQSLLGEGDIPIESGSGNVDDVKVNGVSVVTDKVANVAVPTKLSSFENDAGYITDADIPSIPTKTSELENDSGYITSADVPAPYDDTEIREEISGLDDKIKELELFKFPNVTIIGTPTINNGQISNFSATSYLKFPFLVDFRNQPFEINMAFTTGTNVVNQENIFDSDFGLAFAIRNSRFVIAISTNGTSWDLGEGVGSLTVQPNTTYYVKIAWNGSQYVLYYSFDGVSYTADITKAGTAQPYPKQIYIGICENFATVVNHFSGTINLNNANVKVNGEIFWTGMDDAGISTRADVSLSNIDADGEAKIKEVAETEAINEHLDTVDTVLNGSDTSVVWTEFRELNGVGVETTSTWQALTNYLSCDGLSEIVFTHNTEGWKTCSWWFDEKKLPISSDERFGQRAELQPKTIPVPTGAKYFRVTLRNEGYNTFVWINEPKPLGLIRDVSDLKANVSEINEETTKIKANYTELNAEVTDHENRIDILEKMSKGILYDFVTQTVEGNQSIPKGSHLADIQKLEGKSIVWNQLSNVKTKIGYAREGETYAQARFTVPEIPIGHKLYVSYSYDCSLLPSFTYLKTMYQDTGYRTYPTTYTNAIGKVRDIISSSLGTIKQIIVTGHSSENLSTSATISSDNVFFVDLTQMFGAGNEPTVEQFEAMFPNDYYPYSEPTLQSVDNRKMTVRGKNLISGSIPNAYPSSTGVISRENYTTYYFKVKKGETYSFTSGDGNNVFAFYVNEPKLGDTSYDGSRVVNAINKFVAPINGYLAFRQPPTRTEVMANVGDTLLDYSPYSETEIPLAFVGKSAGTVRDELDLVNKKYIQRVGSIDLGLLNWGYDSINKAFYSIGTNLQTANFLSDIKYQLTGIVGVADMIDKSYHIRPISKGYDGNIYIKDTDITEKSSLKDSLSGVMLYYELAEPIITDVSTVIDSFEVEGNGSIEFDSTIPVRNTIEYLRYLNEV